MQIKFDDTIFRDYDIRGIYPTQINEEIYYILGRAIACYLKVKVIAVGYDTRLSSSKLFKALAEGITDQGTNVVNLGLISTEIHYFASGYYHYGANVIVSASHNPPQYNGLKIVTRDVVPLHGGFGLPEIRKFAVDQNFPPASGKGNITSKNIISDWIKHVLTFIKPEKLNNFKVVVDTGNGMGGITWDILKNKIPIQILPLYFEADGHFPNHLPDPLNPKNLIDLKDKIIESQADLGLATDGDADRLFVLDEKGNNLSGTITTAMLATHLLKKHGPATVLYSVVCGKIVPEKILEYGGKPIRVRVGHSFIKEAMKKENALFAGEHSGHFYFRDNFYADSSAIAGLLLLEYISKLNTPVSTISRSFQKYHSSGEINFKIRKPKEAIKKINEMLADAKARDFIDGLSIWYPDWWFNLRPSNTEPLLRLNIEADSEKKLKVNTQKIINAIIDLGGKKSE